MLNFSPNNPARRDADAHFEAVLKAAVTELAEAKQAENAAIARAFQPTGISTAGDGAEDDSVDLGAAPPRWRAWAVAVLFCLALWLGAGGGR